MALALFLGACRVVMLSIHRYKLMYTYSLCNVYTYLCLCLCLYVYLYVYAQADVFTCI